MPDLPIAAPVIAGTKSAEAQQRRPVADRLVVPAIGIAALLTAWQLLTTLGPYSADQLPGPFAVARAGVEAWRAGLAGHIVASLTRFGIAYALAVGIALPLGLVLGWRRVLWRAVDPAIQVLRPISPIAWFPLAVLWLGIGDLPAIFIIFLAAFFPALLTTVSAVRRVDPTYVLMARNFGTSDRQLIAKVVVPAAFPQIAVGLHIALGSAWVYLVAGEMLGARNGLGFLIVDARNSLRTDLIIVGMAVIGVLGLVIDRAIAAGERWTSAYWGIPERKDPA